MKRFLRPGWIFLYIIGIVRFLWGFVFSALWSGWSLDLDAQVTVKEWETLQTVFDEVASWFWALKLKWFFKNNSDLLTVLQPWTYVFSWTYSYSEFFETLAAGPQVVYDSITVLEWWSIYDIDRDLTRKWLIKEWDYISLATDSDIIQRYTERFSFLSQAEKDNAWPLATLEWFLYPETYFIDKDKNIADQLIFLQLTSYEEIIWDEYYDQLVWLSAQLSSDWYEFGLSTYGAMKLASIIEKEESSDANKPTIASIFYNRLNEGMRLDADISLCYGLETAYEDCPPSVIVQHLDDSSNEFNTRRNSWLTPTPIANFHFSSLIALFDAVPSNNFYYLHDENWRIYPAETLSEHNVNKSKYIK